MTDSQFSKNELHPSKSAIDFSNDVAKLASGTIASQALIILMTPILTRLYGPDAYGLSALFSSIIIVVITMSSLRYEIAIMLPEKDDEAANILGLALIITVMISALTAFFIYFCRQPIVEYLKSPEIYPYLLLIPISIFLNGLFIALSYWNSRSKLFSRLSIAKIMSSFTIITSQLAIGFAGYRGGGSLIVASILGVFISASTLGILIWKEDGQLFRENVNLQRIKEGCIRFKRFPLLDSWSALMNRISSQLPTFLLSWFFSSTTVGYYSLGISVLHLPMNLVGDAVSQVFFQRAVEAKFDHTLPQLVENTFLRLIKIGVYPFLLLTLIGEEAFIVAFGSRWAEAGVYAQIFAFWIFLGFISSPMGSLFSVLEQQGRSLLINILLVTTRAGALLLGGLSGNAILTIALFSIAGMLMYGISCLWILSMTGVSLSRSLIKLKTCIAYNALLLSVILISKFVFLANPEVTVLIGSFTTIIYYFLIVNEDEMLKVYVAHIIAKIKLLLRIKSNII